MTKSLLTPVPGNIPEEVASLTVRGSLTRTLFLQNNYLTGKMIDFAPLLVLCTLLGTPHNAEVCSYSAWFTLFASIGRELLPLARSDSIKSTYTSADRTGPHMKQPQTSDLQYKALFFHGRASICSHQHFFGVLSVPLCLL